MSKPYPILIKPPDDVVGLTVRFEYVVNYASYAIASMITGRQLYHEGEIKENELGVADVKAWDQLPPYNQ